MNTSIVIAFPQEQLCIKSIKKYVSISKTESSAYK